MISTDHGKVLAINEWLFADLLNQNGQDRRGQAGEFLLILSRRPDRILFPTPSPWAEKVFRLSRAANTDMACWAACKLLHGVILRDSAKAVLIDPERARPLEPGQESGIPEEDRYLVRAALAGHADVLVTTDQALLEGVNQSSLSFKAVYRDEFLEEYLVKGTSIPRMNKAP